MILEMVDRLMTNKIDENNIKILKALQMDASISQKQLSEYVNLSQNACWHRLQNLKKEKIIQGQTIRMDRKKLGLGLVVFVMVKTRHHSANWLEKFRTHIRNIPEVIDFFRIGGDYDYLLKIVTRDIHTYDGIYQRLISKIELSAVTSYFAMEAIEEQRPLPISI